MSKIKLRGKSNANRKPDIFCDYFDRLARWGIHSRIFGRTQKIGAVMSRSNSALAQMQGDLFGMPENPVLHIVKTEPEKAPNGLPLSSQKFGYSRPAQQHPLDARAKKLAGDNERIVEKPVFVDRVVEKPVERIVEKIVEKEVVREAEKKCPMSATLAVVAVMGLVALGAIIMSAYNTTQFFVMGGKSKTLAAFAGIMLVMFSAFSFTLAVKSMKEGIFMAAILFPIALCVIGFSVFSAISVSYDQMKKSQAYIAAQDDFARGTAELMKINGDELIGVEAEMERLAGEAEHWKSRSWAKYDNAQEQIKAYQARKAFLLDEKRELNGRSVNQAVENAQTVFAFLAGLFMVPQERIKFFVFAIPAVFYDVASPILFSVIIGLLKKMKI
jgi:hypothetical protein